MKRTICILMLMFASITLAGCIESPTAPVGCRSAFEGQEKPIWCA